MILVKLMGGLGNQLQQYALYEKLIHMGKEAAIDVTWFEDAAVQEAMLAPRKLELNYFDNLTFRKATEAEILKVRGGDGFCAKLMRKIIPGSNHRFYENKMYHPEVLQMDTGYLEGYFAAEKYYADILPVLREKIRFPKCSEDCAQVGAQIVSTEYPVCVHIRRGDYLDPANKEMFGGICTEQYYDKAINYIKEKHPEAVFFVFSDDQAYVKEHYSSAEFVPVDVNHDADSFFDIYLMSLCKAHICANSTFSFWGARLNPREDKVMIRPSKHKNSQVFDAEEMHDLWPGWILINSDGEIV